MTREQADYAEQLSAALAKTPVKNYRDLRRWLRRYEPPLKDDGAGGEPAPVKPHCTLTQQLFNQMRHACEQKPGAKP